MSHSWTFTAPEGYFDDVAALAAQLPDQTLATCPLFSLTPRPYPSDGVDGDTRPWARFMAHVKALNRDAPDTIRYKIFFLTRHGQAYHNLKSEQMRQEAGNTENSFLGVDDTTTCLDACLTPHGITQVVALSRHWLASMAADGLPPPQSLYTSPLTRCLETTALLLRPVMAAAATDSQPFCPIIVDDLRERFTLHACDRRRSRTHIARHWPAYAIDKDLIDDDDDTNLLLLLPPPRPETNAEHQVRLHRALRRVFDADDKSLVVSWTFHSLAMQSLLRLLGLAVLNVHPATTIALLIKGEKGLARPRGEGGLTS